MPDEQAPASGIGLYTISLSWEEGKKENAAQLVPGGSWGKTKVEAQQNLVGALQFALNDAREGLLNARVEAAVEAKELAKRAAE